MDGKVCTPASLQSPQRWSKFPDHHIKSCRHCLHGIQYVPITSLRMYSLSLSAFVDALQILLHALPVLRVHPELAEYIALRPHPLPLVALARGGVLHSLTNSETSGAKRSFPV